MPKINDDKYLVSAGMDDIPHLKEDDITRLLSGVPRQEHGARRKGTPSLGSGAIYPVEEDFLKYRPFPVPKHYPRAFGLDIGGKTGCLWGAWDRETDIIYIYSEYYREYAIPQIHSESIKTRGAWIPGVMDYAGTNLDDNTRMLHKYQSYLEVGPAIKAVEVGITEVLERMETGRLKVSPYLEHFWTEFRMYQRDKFGKVVKKNDHMMDALRYLIMSFIDIAITKPNKPPVGNPNRRNSGDSTAGY